MEEKGQVTLDSIVRQRLAAENGYLKSQLIESQILNEAYVSEIQRLQKELDELKEKSKETAKKGKAPTKKEG